jgi:hypothetical protein
MRTNRIRETIIAQVVGLVEEAFEARASWTDDGGMYVAEHKAAALGRELARTVLQGLIDALGTGHCGQRHTDSDGVVRTFSKYAEKTYQTVVGLVTVRCAAYYGKGASPACTFPLREDLGLPDGDYSQGMDEAIALSGVQDVYRPALKLVNRLTGANVSVHKAETTVAAWGAEAKARVKADLARREGRREGPAATRPIEGLRMCVTTDGGSVHTTEGWRDAKLMVTYPLDAEGRKKGQASYAGTLHYQEDYADLLWQLMERTDASRAEELVWLGDGASWVWAQQATVAPHAVGIVDFRHASERLWAVGRVLHADPGQERAAKQWGKRWIKNLYNGKVAALLKELAKHRPKVGDPPEECADDDPRKVFADAQRYFANNAHRMDYKRYRQLGYPIGSGVVESACRHVVSVRMKRTAAMAWHEDNAEAMLQLRCLSASGVWDRFWGFDTLWQTIRSRAA